MELYLIRHGETAWNDKKLIQGNIDIPLNAEGVNQAKILSEILKEIPFDIIFTSDCRRAKKTAIELAKKTKVKCTLDKRLRNRNFGDWEGLTKKRHL